MTGQTRGAKLGVGSGIPWKAIGIKMATRNEHQCMGKWYSKLEWKPATDETWKMEDNALLADNINKSAATFESDIPWKEISASFSGTYRNAWALRVRPPIDAPPASTATPHPRVPATLTTFPPVFRQPLSHIAE